MKVLFTIEFETDRAGTPKRMKVSKLLEVAPVPEEKSGDGERGCNRVKIADTTPAPIPQEPPPAPKLKTLRPNSGPQFDPGFLAVLRAAPEPFTRRSISVATGLSVVDVTLRFNRLKKKEWIQQPAPGMWIKTETFGAKKV